MPTDRTYFFGDVSGNKKLFLRLKYISGALDGFAGFPYARLNCIY